MKHTRQAERELYEHLELKLQGLSMRGPYEIAADWAIAHKFVDEDGGPDEWTLEVVNEYLYERRSMAGGY